MLIVLLYIMYKIYIFSVARLLKKQPKARARAREQEYFLESWLFE